MTKYEKAALFGVTAVAGALFWIGFLFYYTVTAISQVAG